MGRGVPPGPVHTVQTPLSMETGLRPDAAYDVVITLFWKITPFWKRTLFWKMTMLF